MQYSLITYFSWTITVWRRKYIYWNAKWSHWDLLHLWASEPVIPPVHPAHWQRNYIVWKTWGWWLVNIFIEYVRMSTCRGKKQSFVRGSHWSSYSTWPICSDWFLFIICLHDVNWLSVLWCSLLSWSCDTPFCNVSVFLFL